MWCVKELKPSYYSIQFKVDCLFLTRIYYTVNEQRWIKRASLSSSSSSPHKREEERVSLRNWSIFDCQICKLLLKYRFLSSSILSFNFVAFTYRFRHFFLPLQTQAREWTNAHNLAPPNENPQNESNPNSKFIYRH